MINSQVAVARELTEFEFEWYGLRRWNPSDRHFSNTSQVGPASWRIGNKLRFLRWAWTRTPDVYHSIFHATPFTARVVKAILGDQPIIQTVQTLHSSDRKLQASLMGDHLIAVSTRLARAIDRVSRAPVSVIYPAVDPTRLTLSEFDIRAQLSLPAQKPLVLYPGGWGPGLGAIDAIRCFESVASESDAHLVIANRPREADDPETEEFAHDYARRHPSRVSIVGSVANFPSLISEASVLLFPASDLRDQKLDIPLVLLEAMYFGVPLAVYDVEPISEVKPRTVGVAALPGDTYSLAKGVLDLISDIELRPQIAATARSRARSEFHPARIAKKLGDTYRSTLGL